MTKNELRGRVMAQRRALAADWIADASRVIQARVVGLPAFRAARVVCGYMAMAREVQMDRVFEAAWAAGKRICVPVHRAEDDSYGLAEVTSDAVLAPAHGGVLEPVAPVWIDPAIVDLVIVPGLAFDQRGGRVGRGKGYYDRILGGLPQRERAIIGVAFGFQLFDRVAVEAHDVFLDAVITEK